MKLTAYTRRLPQRSFPDPSYQGFVRVQHEGGSYVIACQTLRISRGDAQKDATDAAYELCLENGLKALDA